MRKKGKCIDCNVEISSTRAKRCKKCDSINRKTAPNRRIYARNWYLKKKYDLSPEEFDAYWIVAKGKCFICNKELELPKSQRGQNLNSVAIDHDHKTNQVRGLLCNACNTGIGFLNDDIKILKNAIEYLGG